MVKFTKQIMPIDFRLGAKLRPVKGLQRGNAARTLFGTRYPLVFVGLTGNSLDWRGLATHTRKRVCWMVPTETPT
jgi:hypothetical protein